MKSASLRMRVLALLSALALFGAVLSMTGSPLVILSGLAAFLLVCSKYTCGSETSTASHARDGPNVRASDAFLYDRTMRRNRRRQRARKYFLQCRLWRPPKSSKWRTMSVLRGYSNCARPPGLSRSMGVAIRRKAQCNLIAFNANDQGCFPAFAA